MANQEHLEILMQGVEVWNQWRGEHAHIRPDFSKASLRGADLAEINLRGANLISVSLSRANLIKADLTGADFFRADLRGTNLSDVDLSGADLSAADLSDADLSDALLFEANFSRANLSGTSLRGANLQRATLVETNLTGTDLTQCSVFGISVWSVELKGAKQNNLVITPEGEPTITVDNLKIAQFIYLLLNNAEIREVIDTIARKAVLILGRFTPERKAVLDALREALRTHGYVPILFDFDKPSSQDLTETVSTLAHLSRFIIADLTDPSSAPYEVGTIASNHVRPIQALFHPSDEAKRVFAMYPDLIRRYHWVLPPFEYQGLEHLLASLQTKVIEPAEQKAQELEKR
jgi:Pentapeptide repeats (8 copies)